MTYGADVAGMLASLAALATLCLSLRRPRGKHRKSARVQRGGRPSKPESGNGLMPPRILPGYFIAWCLLVAVR